MEGFTGVARTIKITGEYTKVWFVVRGVCGCTNGFLGFLDETAAKVAAEKAEKANEAGLSFYEIEADFE